MLARLNHGHGISPTPFPSPSHGHRPIRTPFPHFQTKPRTPLPTLKASKKQPGSKGSRGFITVSFPSGQWAGDWAYDYTLSLKDLGLQDLAQDGRAQTQVHVTLSLHKHAGFGVSADGRVLTSIARTCSSCSSSYLRHLDTAFCLWVLPSAKDQSSDRLPDLGGDDPSVIYVKPGDDAVLDPFVQETVRLQILVKETCSEACEKADTKLHFIGVQKTASLDRRWSKLRDYKNTYFTLSQRDD